MEGNHKVSHTVEELLKTKVFPHHACAIAVVAVLHFGSRLSAMAITPWTGVLYAHRYLLIDTLGSLSECQLHQKLGNKMRD